MACWQLAVLVTVLFVHVVAVASDKAPPTVNVGTVKDPGENACIYRADAHEVLVCSEGNAYICPSYCDCDKPTGICRKNGRGKGDGPSK